jgi:hypothetical protein
MLPDFLIARLRQYIGGAENRRVFRARSADRDALTDRSRVELILSTIEAALSEAEKEQAGLGQRVKDVLAYASVTIGNGTDEYLTREPLDNHHHNLFDSEIKNGQRRLGELAASVAHFKFLRAATLSRFSDFKRGKIDDTADETSR